MTAVVQEVGIVQTLANAGATDFLVVNQPPLGSIPRLKGDPADAAALTAAAATFNQGLQLLLPQVPLDHPSASFHIYQLDVFTLFNSVIASPSTYGFTNVTDSSQDVTTVDPDTYLFWDGLHPQPPATINSPLPQLSLITPGSTSTSLSVSPMAADFGASITLTATVSSTSGIAPGTVTFYDGTTALGTGQLSGASPDVATITTSSLASGSHSLTAVYAASQYFTASTSSAVTEVIATPAIAASISPVGLSVTSGSSGTVTISVAASGGFAGTVGLSCGALPSPLTCSFAPGSLVFAGGDNTLTSTLTINTAGNVSRLIAPQGSSSVIGSIAMCSLLPIFGLITLRRRAAGRVVLLSLVLLLSFGAVLGLSGCGSNSSSGAHTGNYSVSVNVSTGASTTTQSFVVTVTK